MHLGRLGQFDFDFSFEDVGGAFEAAGEFDFESFADFEFELPSVEEMGEFGLQQGQQAFQQSSAPSPAAGSYQPPSAQVTWAPVPAPRPVAAPPPPPMPPPPQPPPPPVVEPPPPGPTLQDYKRATYFRAVKQAQTTRYLEAVQAERKRTAPVPLLSPPKQKTNLWPLFAIAGVVGAVLIIR